MPELHIRDSRQDADARRYTPTGDPVQEFLHAVKEAKRKAHVKKRCSGVWVAVSEEDGIVTSDDGFTWYTL